MRPSGCRSTLCRFRRRVTACVQPLSWGILLHSGTAATVAAVVQTGTAATVAAVVHTLTFVMFHCAAHARSLTQLLTCHRVHTVTQRTTTAISLWLSVLLRANAATTLQASVCQYK